MRIFKFGISVFLLLFEQSVKFYMKINFIHRRQRPFKFVVYKILGEINISPFCFQIFLIIVRNWGLELKKDVEPRIDLFYTLVRIEDKLLKGKVRQAFRA